jgi:maleylacetate reductase
VIVRWSLADLPAVLSELGVRAPLLIASNRWSDLELGVDPVGTWHEVPTERVGDVAGTGPGADVILAVGGGSAIDLGKAVSSETGLPLVSVPTTYSGAEWTTMFGVRDPHRIMRGGGAGAHPEGIVYDASLTLELPLETTVGTAMNALDHCAEALYVKGHNPAADAHALKGASLIDEWLPKVVERPVDSEARRGLLEGAAEAGAALGGAGLALAHAMAQAVGGAYGLPHGTLNGICLPPVLRFNAELVPDAVRRFGEALGTDDPAARVEELTALGGQTRLRDLGVPEADLPELAETAAGRAGNQANPRPATPEEIEQLLRSVW